MDMFRNTKRTPKVSIIVPCYGVEKYLDRCLNSLVSQTLQDIEIILVDDKSPDNVPIMCDEWARKDNRIKVIHKEVNEGLGYARNTGLKYVEGEYVAFVDSDDYVDTDMYRKLYEQAKNSCLDTCYCSFCYDKQDGHIIKRTEVTQYEEHRGRKAVDNFLLTMIGPLPSYPHEVKYLMCVWKAIYSVSLIKRYNIYFDNERVMASEDILFHLKYLHLADSIGFIPDNLYHYCENINSISHSYSEKKWLLICSSVIEVKKRLNEGIPEKKWLPHMQRYLFLSLRGVLSHDINNTDCSFFQKLSNLKYRCANDAYKDLFRNYPYWKLGFAKALLYLSMKYRVTILIYAILYFKQRLKK